MAFVTVMIAEIHVEDSPTMSLILEQLLFLKGLDGEPGSPGKPGAPGLAGIAPPVTIDAVCR